MNDFSLLDTRPCYDDISQAYKDALSNLIIALEDAINGSEDRIALVKLSETEIEFIKEILEEKEIEINKRFQEE